MGNQLLTGSTMTGYDVPKRQSPESRALVDQLRKCLSFQGLITIVQDWQMRHAPKEYFDWHDFDILFSPLINNPLPLFEFLKEGHNINVLEVIISLVIFCRAVDYDERIQLVFNLFDIDGGGALDRKELSKLLNCTIYGLTKLAGLPQPSKVKVTEYITEIFKAIDTDGGGQIEYDEFKDYVDQNMQIQDFILRYSGVQTHIRAQAIYQTENNRWLEFFKNIAVDYFGDLFVEYDVLVRHLEVELAAIDPVSLKKLYHIFNYEGQQVVSEHDFVRIMQTWSAFTANDINNDNVLDMQEIKMLIWLISNAKPTQAVLEREMLIMDRDHSNTIDRIEWVSYLSAPKNSVYQLGNMDYYNFEMRDLFEEIDSNGDGSIEIEELMTYIKHDFKSNYDVLDHKRKVEAEPIIRKLAMTCITELKALALEYANPNIEPNMDPDSLTWVEFVRFPHVGKPLKVEVVSSLTVLYHKQRQEQFLKSTSVEEHKATDAQTRGSKEEVKQAQKGGTGQAEKVAGAEHREERKNQADSGDREAGEQMGSEEVKEEEEVKSPVETA